MKTKIDLDMEAIEIQKIFRKGYKTYWAETQAIKDYLKHLIKTIES